MKSFSKYQLSFFIVLFFCVISTFYADEHECQIDILEHKQMCLEEILLNYQEKNNRGWYPIDRMRETINGDDTDYIPKVIDAGKVFEEKGIRYQLMHNGIKVLEHGYYGEWMTDIIYSLRGHHEPQEEKVFYEVLKNIPSNATMIELGSYWGYYSLWFSKDVQGAKNYLVEPVLSNMDLGKNNFALNGQQAQFFLGYVQRNPRDSFTFPSAKKIHIDTFLEENEIKHVNILHSDIQGAEYEMLLSCSRAIENNQIDYFFISTHSSDLHNACQKLLLEADYLIIAEHDMDESCSFDGLIVARRKNVLGPEHVSIKKYTNP